MSERGEDDEVEPGELLALALSYLRDAEVAVDVLGPELAVGAHDAHHGRLHLVVRTRELDRQLTVYARWPTVVPPDRRRAVMELVTRVNPELPAAWLELDLDDGRVSARTGLTLLGVRPDGDALAENAVSVAVETMDAYAPLVRAVALDGLEVCELLGGPHRARTPARGAGGE